MSDVLDTLMEREEAGDDIAAALIAWGVYTAVSEEYKRHVWRAYLALTELSETEK